MVLPFVELTPEKASQTFCDGLTEELSNRLSQIANLQVVARTSALAFRGQGEDVRTIGKALDTSHVLEGSVRRSGNNMRVTVHLVDARNGYRLWSANYDAAAEDVIRVQEDLRSQKTGLPGRDILWIEALHHRQRKSCGITFWLRNASTSARSRSALA